MSRIRKILIAVLAVVLTVCVSVALAACVSEPGFRNPNEAKNKYVINVQSQGGLRLDNIQFSVKKDGEVKYQGISVNGLIEFDLEPDEYEIVIDEGTLPPGYYLPVGEKYKTSTENKTVNVKLSSKIIKQTAPAGTRYVKGNVMYDFEYTDAATGKEYTLAKTLDEKKAVVLNFYGTTCVPCQSEFPAINTAYNEYKDKLELFAISSYNRDSERDIIKYNEDNNYNFPISLDPHNITAMFKVTSYPTTVIIDRYGVVAYVSEGAEPDLDKWKSIFNKYTSDNYSQIDITDYEGETLKRPEDYVMPDSAAIKEAIGDSNGRITDYYYDFTSDEYTWPWQIGGEGNDRYLTASNAGAAYSYSIISMDIELSPLEGIEFDYNLKTFEGDSLYIVMDGKQYFRKSGNSGGWKTEKLLKLNNDIYYSTASRTVQFSFIFIQSDPDDVEASALIRNIHVYNAVEYTGIKDFAVSIVDGKKIDNNNSYNLGSAISKDEEGLYYYNYTDEEGNAKKSLLLVDLINVTAWTDLHYGEPSFMSPEEGSESSFVSSLYYLSYWFMSNWNTMENNEILRINYDPEATVIFGYMLQGFSENGYIPVNDKIIKALNAFIAEAYKTEALNLKDEKYDDQWLEFCYYFRHFGADHVQGEKCWETEIPVTGLSFDYAIETGLGETKVDITSILNLWTLDNDIESGGGVKFKFTPDKDGIYNFYSTHKEDANANPRFMIIDPERKHIIADNDNDPRYDHMYNSDGSMNDDAFLYIELKAGQTYYITAMMFNPSLLGSYTMHIEYVEESYVEIIRTATAGGGFWTWYEDENGNPVTDADGNIIYYYIAQNVALNPEDNVYYRLSRDNDYESPMYIDFLHPNFLDDRGRSLEQLINSKAFGEENTEKLKVYYEKAIARDKNDKLYGLCEAEKDIVAVISNILGEQTSTGEWQQAACYIESYGTK